MSNVATVLVGVNVAALLPTANAAYKKTTITLTDSAAAVQTADVNGTETPAWTAVFNSVAAGAGTVSAQAFDVNGLAIGAAATNTFTEIGSPPPATFPQPITVTVTPS